VAGRGSGLPAADKPGTGLDWTHSHSDYTFLEQTMNTHNDQQYCNQSINSKCQDYIRPGQAASKYNSHQNMLQVKTIWS